MNRNIRNFVLHNSFLRELFFILKGKKVNCKKIDKKNSKAQSLFRRMFCPE